MPHTKVQNLTSPNPLPLNVQAGRQKKNQQQTQQTYDVNNRNQTQATLVCMRGKCALASALNLLYDPVVVFSHRIHRLRLLY